MNDRLTKIAEIIAQQGFTDYRLRLIGGTRTAALELRGLSDADMATLAGNVPVAPNEDYKVAFDTPSDVEIVEKQPVSDVEKVSNPTRMSFFGKKSVDSE